MDDFGRGFEVHIFLIGMVVCLYLTNLAIPYVTKYWREFREDLKWGTKSEAASSGVDWIFRLILSAIPASIALFIVFVTIFTNTFLAINVQTDFCDASDRIMGLRYKVYSENDVLIRSGNISEYDWDRRNVRFHAPIFSNFVLEFEGASNIPLEFSSTVLPLKNKECILLRENKLIANFEASWPVFDGRKGSASDINFSVSKEGAPYFEHFEKDVVRPTGFSVDITYTLRQMEAGEYHFYITNSGNKKVSGTADISLPGLEEPRIYTFDVPGLTNGALLVFTLHVNEDGFTHIKKQMINL